MSKQLTTPRLLISGVINWDTTLFVDRLPAPGEELQVRRIISGPGGKGANTAASTAVILGPSKVGVIGGIGTDDIASKQMQILQCEGIDTSCIVKQKNLSSGQAFIIVDQSSGENIVLTTMSANELALDSILQSTTDVITRSIHGAEMIVIIDPPFNIADQIAKRAKAEKKQLIVSPGLLSQRGLLSLKAYLNKADIIILNEPEARALTSTSDAVYAGSQISQVLDGKRVVVTLGSRGCMLFADGKRALVPPIDLAHFGLKVVNTVGAGDVFVGTFAAFKLEGLGDVESLLLANIAAGLKTTKEETRGSPSRRDIMRCSNDQKMRSLIDRIKLT